jgi:hypothetical protein
MAHPTHLTHLTYPTYPTYLTYPTYPTYFASGSGRSWNRITLLVVPLPVSM